MADELIEQAGQKVTANPLGTRNSHHIRLFRNDDDDNMVDEVGLVLCDAKANENFKAMDLIHTPQESLKTASGATKHSDFEPPYSSMEIEDWSQGRGYADNTKQKGGYLDAWRMNTIKPDYLYPVGAAEEAEIPTDYLKLDYRLSNETVLWQRKIGYPEGEAPDQYHMRYGSAFYCEDDYLSVTAMHIHLTPAWSISANDLPVLQVLIYDVTPVTEVDINGDPICYLPNTSSLVGTMTMDADSVIGVVNGVPKEIVFRTTVGFDLDIGKLYYACLDVVTESLYDYWMFDVVDSNLYTWAQEIKSTDGGAWESTQNCGIHWEFYMTGNANPFKAHFAEINRCLHVGIEPLNGDAGAILKNGELGLGNFRAYAAPTEKGMFRTITDIEFDSGYDKYQDQMLKILDGPGAKTNKDWARIVSLDGDESINDLELTHQFGLENANESDRSKYVLQNSLHFTEVDVDPVITHPVRDILSAMGALYVSFGDDAENVRRLRYMFDYDTPEVTIEWVDEDYWADMMAQQIRAGNNFIWRIRKYWSMIVPADAVNLRDEDETAILEFDPENESSVGNTEYQINSWAIYGDDPHLWIMKEDKPYEIVAEDVYEFRNSAMSSMADSRNSRAAIQHDTYLYFSFHDGVQRWHYNGDLFNHGPEVIGPAGMPWSRQGSFADFAGYGSILIGAFDAGEHGTSSLLAWNGSGWTELYRAGQPGVRILSCYIQSMDGKPVDWLWFSEGSRIMRIPISANPLSQMNDEYFYYPFAKNATLDSSWISLGLKDVEKYINKFKIVSFKAPSPYDVPVDEEDVPICESPAINQELTDANPGTYYAEGVTLAWRTDPCAGWTNYTDGIQDPLIMMGDTEANAIVDAEAEQLQYKLGIISADDRYPVVVDALVMDSVVRLPFKSQIRIQFRLKDNDNDRNEMPDPYPTAKEKYDRLSEYAEQPSPVWAQIDAKFIGERRFFIDQGSLQVIEKMKDQGLETLVMTCVLKEA